MSDSFASRFMSPDEKTAMIARDPQSAQALHNGPRTGFGAQLATLAGSGCSFRKTIKNTILGEVPRPGVAGVPEIPVRRV